MKTNLPGWRQGHPASRFLQHKSRREDSSNTTKQVATVLSTQAEGISSVDKKISSDILKTDKDELISILESTYLLNSSRLKSPKKSRTSQCTSLQLTSGITSESTRSSCQCGESIATSIDIDTSLTSAQATSKTMQSSSEISTCIHFTEDATASKILKVPAVDCLSYTTRGFKFSYFQYYSN